MKKRTQVLRVVSCLSALGLLMAITSCNFKKTTTTIFDSTSGESTADGDVEYGENCFKIEGTDFYKRQTTYYTGQFEGTEPVSTKIDAYYKQGEGICYVDVVSLFNYFADNFTSDPTVFANTTANGKATIAFKGQEGIMQSIVLDTADNTVSISSPNYYSLYFEGEGHTEYGEYKYDTLPYAQTRFGFDLDDYGLSAYNVDGKVLLPLSIYNLIYTQEFSYDYYYINGNIYASSAGYQTFEGQSNESCTLAVRDLTYKYFLLFFHQYYGLSHYMGLDTVEKIETFLAKYKSDILSTNRGVFEQAEADIFNQLLDDPHSGLSKNSIYHGNYTIDSNYGSRIIKISTKAQEFSEARSEKYNEYKTAGKLTELTVGTGPTKYTVARVVGNTAIISFDSFEYDSDKDHPGKNLVKNDLFSLMYYALEEIDKYSANTSTIENVLVDLSCNTGGYVIAGMELLSFMTNDPIVWRYDFMNTHTYASQVTKVDNDGDFDDNDAHTQYKWFIQTSAVSFSCGNLVPYLAQEYGYAKIIGGTSGGGMCVVGTGVLPDGTYFQKSSATGRNGSLNEVSDDSYRSCESGVVPDKTLVSRNYYDLDGVVTAINSLNA